MARVLGAVALLLGASGVCGAAGAGQAPACARESSACTDVSDSEESVLYQKMMVRSRVAGLEAASASPAERLMEPGRNVSKRAHDLLRQAEKAAGVKSNKHGDLNVFLSALMTNSAMMAGCIAIFIFLRHAYPLVFMNNALKGLSHLSEADFPTGPLGWARASWSSTSEEIESSVGLDNAMLLEFSELSMRLMVRIGVPLVCVLAPMHLAFGGVDNKETDRLSRISLANVNDGHWLFWVHGLMVWYVVLVVQSSVYAAQRAFMPRRTRWLQNMPEPRGTTVLVEGIPEEQQSDGALLGFFKQLFGEDKVKSAYVVKQTGKLLDAIAQRDRAKAGLAEAEAAKRSGGGHSLWCCRGTGHREAYWTQQLREAELAVRAERQAIAEAAPTPGGVNCCNGFVTFCDRSDAEVAQSIEYSTDIEEWVVSTPPDPRSILWEDLKQSTQLQVGREAVGYGLIAGLYVGYLPLVIVITNLAIGLDLGPLLQPFWAGIAPTAGLTIMVSFLPTFLILIFRQFFTLKDDAWAQHKLQKWYFWFQVVFVLVVTAVGNSVIEFTTSILAEPIKIFQVLAETMPQTTHFYMSYLLVQCVAHCHNILRYVPLTKFLAFRKLYDEEVARAMSEPEDQDYYGLGSRSARWTVNLLIGIIFSTISPALAPLCFLNFFVTRLLYGYLIPFAETKKPDLGGVFWVTKLECIFIGCLIYIVMMVGILLDRGHGYGPALVAAPSAIWVLWSHQRFRTEFYCEKLPYPELKAHPAKVQSCPLKYEQPELADA